MKRQNTPDIAELKKNLYRSNTAVLETAIIAFQVAAMLILAFKTRPIDLTALALAAAMPLVTTFVMRLNEKLWPIDRALLLLTLFLMSVSAVILKDILKASSSFNTHMISMALGLAAMFFGTALIRNLRDWEKLTDFLVWFTVPFLFSPMLLGKWTNGAKNWIRITSFLTIQPSEWVKAFLPVYLASRFSGEGGLRRTLPALIAAALYCAALLIERDLGALLIYFLVTCAVFYAGTQNLPLTLLGLGAGAGGAVGAYHLFPYVAKRIEMFVNPWSDPMDKGYQIIQALIAIGSGGIFGKGLGLGYPRSVPLYNSDFVFVAIAEEFGLIFAAGLLLVYLLLFWRGVTAAMNARRQFHALLSLGIVFTIAIQAFVNVGGNIKMIPMTGLTLPFISSGSNSMISMLFMAGMLLGVTSLNASDEMSDFNRLNDIQQGGKNHGKTQGWRIRRAQRPHNDLGTRGTSGRGTGRGVR